MHARRVAKVIALDDEDRRVAAPDRPVWIAAATPSAKRTKDVRDEHAD